ncbi:MAG TPA: 5'-nucleotidase, lipoprotein e(P4) family [Parafilimonas sp.]|nr:5'-nucleotidase, lipoprotein e(P4) family [Parafilimonas sp.]
MKKLIVAFVLMLTVCDVSAQDSTTKFEILKLYPVLWQQTAAEYRALCYQAFNAAKMRLDAIPKKKFKKERLAIITDLDETILDNSYLPAQLIKTNRSSGMLSWLDWTTQSAATAVPGAVDFLTYAHKKGVTIFYISNRFVSEVQPTLINLQKLHLPDADSSHLLFRGRYSSKESRRQNVMQFYNVVMLLGDNLNDFMDVFEHKSISERLKETDDHRDDWGNKFIVLPNATYGEWENALFNYDTKLTPVQKLAVLKALLKGFSDGLN